MPRSPDVLDDPSPLGSPTVTVNLRVGWLLRTHRIHTPGAPRTGALFARELDVTQTALTKWEKGHEDPDPTSIEAYERVLGQSPGVLRATVAGLRREFGQPRRRPEVPVHWGLEEMSERTAAALEGRADGADWMRFAATLQQAVSPPVPVRPAREAVDRLVSELVRSVDGAYLTRLDALSLLRTGAYADVVQDACLAFAADPDVEAADDVVSVIGALPTARALDVVASMLDHPRRTVAAGAAHAISTMLRNRPSLDPAALRAVAPTVLAAYAASADDPARHATLSALVRQLPPGFRRYVEEKRLPALHAPLAESESDVRRTHRLATDLAVAVMHRLDARPEPLLARTLHEALADHDTLRGQWARLVLMALPYRDVVAEVVTAEAARVDGRQAGALATLLTHLGTAPLPQAERWLGEDDPRIVSRALPVLAHAAERVDGTRLRTLLDTPDATLRSRVLYAAGMVGAPELADWTEDSGLDEQVRRGAGWWIRQGTRVDDRPHSRT